ncbi:hypothetical protein VTK26DRAFT_8033 [Humicola hyalothermophila]
MPGAGVPRANRSLRRVPANPSLRQAVIATAPSIGTESPPSPCSSSSSSSSPGKNLAQQQGQQHYRKEQNSDETPESQEQNHLASLSERVNRLEETTRDLLGVLSPIAGRISHDATMLWPAGPRGSTGIEPPTDTYLGWSERADRPRQWRRRRSGRGGSRRMGVGEMGLEESGTDSEERSEEEGEENAEDKPLPRRRESLRESDFDFGLGNDNGATAAATRTLEEVPRFVALEGRAPPKRVRFSEEVEVLGGGFEGDDDNDDCHVSWFQLEQNTFEDRSLRYPVNRLVAFREHEERPARSGSAMSWRGGLARVLRRCQRRARADLSRQATGWESLEGLMRELVRGAPIGKEGLGEEGERYEQRFAREQGFSW